VYVDLFDSALAVRINPPIESDQRYFFVDVARANPGHAWVLAASGRVDVESYSDTTLHCVISGAADTIMVMRAVLPRQPLSVDGGDQYTWDERSHTIFVTGEAAPAGVSLSLHF
jgi:hypothetical protein